MIAASLRLRGRAGRLGAGAAVPAAARPASGGLVVSEESAQCRTLDQPCFPIHLSWQITRPSELAQPLRRVPRLCRRDGQRQQLVLPHAGRLYAPTLPVYQNGCADSGNTLYFLYRNN
jgi:hypothetical protein